MQRAADERDLAMAERGKVLDCLANSFAVVHFENADVWQVGAGIDKDERELAFDEFLDQFFFDAEGHDGDAVDAALEHAADERLGAHRIVVRGADEDFVALRDGEILKLLDQLREKWICDLRNDEAEHAAAAGDECASLCVGNVADFLDGVPDALSEFWIDGGDAD